MPVQTTAFYHGSPHRKEGGTVPNVLKKDRQLQVLKLLVEGNSIRSTERYLHPGLDAQREAVERLGPLQLGIEPR